VSNYSLAVIYVKPDSVLQRERAGALEMGQNASNLRGYRAEPPPFAASAGIVHKLRA
jgi:hypothetical protein